MPHQAPPRERNRLIQRYNWMATCFCGVVLIVGAVTGIVATTIATDRHFLNALSKETIGAIIGLFTLFLALGVGLIFAGVIKSVDGKL